MSDDKTNVEEKKVGEIDISVLFSEDTSDEAKASIRNVFEAAVEARAEEKLAEEAAIRDQLVEEQLAEALGAMEEMVDKYVSYVAEKWLEENEIAIESSLQVEMARSLMDGLAGLFAEHNLEVPDDADDVLEGLVARNEELVEKLNDAVRENMTLQEEAEGRQLEGIVAEMVTGLPETQASKLRTLAEGIRYRDAADFRQKLDDVRGAFFKETRGIPRDQSSEDADEPLSEGVTHPNRNQPDADVKLALGGLSRLKR